VSIDVAELRPRRSAAPLAGTLGIDAAPGEPIAASPLARAAVLAYGLFCYATFLAAFAYYAGFVGGFLTPTRLDGPRTGPFGAALVVDLALLAAFAVQHSVMARPWFKRRWTKLVPPVIERSTYVLVSGVLVAALFAWWRPLGGVVWELQAPLARGAMLALFGLGLLIVFVATLNLNHFDLFGLRQTWQFARGRSSRQLPFQTPGPYRLVRHPLYVGWIISFWAAPVMSAAHLLFAAAMTIYILLAIRWEEHDLVALHPEYAEHRRRVPMLLPRLRRSAPAGR
jgi:protein-S-isoprenylcysteine O-methyltransferase Ste14